MLNLLKVYFHTLKNILMFRWNPPCQMSWVMWQDEMKKHHYCSCGYLMPKRFEDELGD